MSVCDRGISSTQLPWPETADFGVSVVGCVCRGLMEDVPHYPHSYGQGSVSVCICCLSNDA